VTTTVVPGGRQRRFQVDLKAITDVIATSESTVSRFRERNSMLEDENARLRGKDKARKVVDLISKKKSR
jgi:hypothetical protein